jgi:hypothetical protein
MSEIYSGLVNGQPYIIGREGHIGRITFRDVGSGNGTYIFKNGKYVAFKRGFVKEDDQLMIGTERYFVHELLERISLARLR